MNAIPIWRVQRERGNRLLMRLTVTLALRVGRPVGRALLYPICAYFMVFSRHARVASKQYLRRVLGRASTVREGFHHYHSFASQILDRVYLLSGDLRRFDCSVEGLELLEAALAQKRGVLLFGAHLGSFEMMRMLALTRCPTSLRVLMYEANAQKLGSVLARLNVQAPRQVIRLGRPETMLEVREALSRGEMVGLLADRVVRGDRVRACNFFGERAPFPEGPFLLAATLGAPVLLFSAVRADDGAYRVLFEPFAQRLELPHTSRDASLQQACERYAAWLEMRCRDAPYNWFNFYDFWAAPQGWPDAG